MYFAGIDWADDHHDVCIIDENGTVIIRFTIPHEYDGIETLFEQVRRVTPLSDQIPFALETDKGLLVSALLDEGYTVYPINPKAVDRYRDRYTPAGSKNDAFDAEVLANILRTDGHRFRPLLPDSEQAQALKILTRDHRELIRHRTRLTNQLTACLKSYYPVAMKLFGKVYRPSALNFLEAFPTMKEAKSLSLDRIKAFLTSTRYPGVDQKAEEIYGLLQQPHLEASKPLVIHAKSMLMLSFVAQLKVLGQHISSYEKHITTLFDEHHDSHIFSSLPGAADTLAPRLLAELGDNRERYQSYSRLQAEAGTAPVTKSSSRHRFVYFRFGCKKPLRSVMQQLAFCSLKRCEWARQYYDQLRNRGKTHQHAVRALANIWVKIIYAMWRDHTEYNETVFLKAREAHS